MKGSYELLECFLYINNWHLCHSASYSSINPWDLYDNVFHLCIIVQSCATYFSAH